MSKAQHTPGPWKADGFHGHEIAASNGWTVAYIGSHEKITEEDNANARLIAAAPELLEALKEALKDYDLCGEACGNTMKKARAAIAKATGDA